MSGLRLPELGKPVHAPYWLGRGAVRQAAFQQPFLHSVVILPGPAWEAIQGLNETLWTPLRAFLWAAMREAL